MLAYSFHVWYDYIERLSKTRKSETMKELAYNGYTVHYHLISAVNSFGRNYKYAKMIRASSPDGTDVTLEVNGESGNIGPMQEAVWIEGIKRGIRRVSQAGYVWEPATGSARF